MIFKINPKFESAYPEEKFSFKNNRIIIENSHLNGENCPITFIIDKEYNAYEVYSNHITEHTRINLISEEGKKYPFYGKQLLCPKQIHEKDFKKKMDKLLE